MRFDKVTRVTVVTADGLAFEQYDAYQHGVEIHLQDDGRTLKLFPASAPAIPTQSALKADCGEIYDHESHIFHNEKYDATDYCDGMVK
jgi:hypothetical protein